jgi:hypothetical protein
VRIGLYDVTALSRTRMCKTLGVWSCCCVRVASVEHDDLLRQVTRHVLTTCVWQLTVSLDVRFEFPALIDRFREKAVSLSKI